MKNVEIANITQLDKIKWFPWVGKNYKNTKLLILGESHYEDGDEWQEGNPQTTIQITKKYLMETPGDWKLYKNVERVLINKLNLSFAEKNALWNSIIYWNLVQRLLDSRAREDRPTDDDFDIGWKLFFEVCDIIEPEFCLVLGKSSYGRLGYYLSNSQSDWIKEDSLNFPNEKIFVLHKKINMHKLTLVFINHPSGSFGFDYSYWHPIVKKEFENLNI